MHCYFHLVSTHKTIPDDEGIEVVDLDEACATAFEVAAEVIRDSSGNIVHWRGWRLEATNGSGTILFAINLDDLVG